MKKIILFLIAAFVLLQTTTSCSDYLDINVDPDNPTNETIPASIRLPWLQYAYGYAYGNAACASSVLTGQNASRSGGTNTAYTAYAPGTGNGPTTPYQQWFVSGANNLADMITIAEKEEAYHFIGAAHAIHAMGFALMVDYYGEMPYYDALGSSLSPKYDSGETIYKGCLERLDTAIMYFQKTQPVTATKLDKGDSWNGGDVQKWIKMCYGFKARLLNNMSKKSAYYDPDAILDAVSKGPQSVEQSTIVHHENDPSDTQGSSLLGVGDPMKTSFGYDIGAWGNWARINKWYLDLLENPRGSGIEDPRVDRLVPSSQHWGPGGTKYFTRTQGVDVINSDIRVNLGPMHPSYSTTTKKWSIASTNPDRQNDTVYCLLQTQGAMQGNTTGEGTWYASDGIIMSTSTFYTFPESQTDVMTYHEMCFIKAEVLFRKGDKGGALTAYKDGIQAHMDLMQAKLRTWNGGKNSENPNPGKMPMNDADIATFMSSAALAQTAGELTLADIMTQKHIAMSWTVQNWNDVRRYNYSAGNIGGFGVVYPGLDQPYEFKATVNSHQYFPGTSKTDVNYWFRRMKQCSHEKNYNIKNLLDAQPKAQDVDIYSIPVWWDIEE